MCEAAVKRLFFKAGSSKARGLTRFFYGFVGDRPDHETAVMLIAEGGIPVLFAEQCEVVNEGRFTSLQSKCAELRLELTS